MTNWISSFNKIGMDDLPSVGSKNPSLGEIRRALTPLGIRTPDGFATTADTYRAFLRAADLERVITNELRHLNIDRIDTLQAAGGRIRSTMLAAALPDSLIQGVSDAYRASRKRSTARTATSPSAAAPRRRTCPTPASPASRRRSCTWYTATRCCSTSREALLCLALHQRSRRDRVSAFAARVRPFAAWPSRSACRRWSAPISPAAGVMFSIDTETGFAECRPHQRRVPASATSVVQGTVNPDQFYVFKPTLATGIPAHPPEEARHQGVQAGLRGGRHAPDAQRPGRPRTTASALSSPTTTS